jgi:hypothetical protein
MKSTHAASAAPSEALASVSTAATSFTACCVRLLMRSVRVGEASGPFGSSPSCASRYESEPGATTRRHPLCCARRCVAIASCVEISAVSSENVAAY